VIRTFPRALVHGPLEYGGLEIPDLFTEQLIAHVTTILRYGPEVTDPTGILLHATGEAMRLEVGFNGELLAAPLVLAANVTSLWIKHVWMAMQERGVTISTNFADIPLRHHGDIEIMRLFVQNGWKQPDLHILDSCRMFLQAFLLSDIVDGSGRGILSLFWDRPHPLDSSYTWPRTPVPSQAAWRLWQRALATSLNVGRNQKLAVPLGKWFAEAKQLGWYYHLPTNSLWFREQAQWFAMVIFPTILANNNSTVTANSLYPHLWRNSTKLWFLAMVPQSF